MSFEPLIKHVIWDWNGTLLDDADITIRSSVEWLASIGKTSVTRDDVRAHSSRDLRQFFSRFLERPICEEELVSAKKHYGNLYEPARFDQPLAKDAKPALEKVLKTGRTQSILSMAPHGELTELVAYHGIADWFRAVDGARDHSIVSKYESLLEHLKGLDQSPETVALIGDSLDDFEVSTAAGVEPILVATGMYSAERLSATGAPVAHSIEEAIMYLK